jgi:hypothetical protein
VDSGTLDHCHALKKLTTEFDPGEYVWDEIPELRKLERGFNVNADSFKHGIPSGEVIECYTDGSN